MVLVLIRMLLGFIVLHEHNYCLDCGVNISMESHVRRIYGYCVVCEMKKPWQDRICDIV